MAATHHNDRLRFPDDRLLWSNIGTVGFLMNLRSLLMTFTTRNESALSKEVRLKRFYRWQVLSVACASYLSFR